MCHARKERVLMIGTDQRIISGPAARTAASRGRIHGCTRIVSRKVRFFSLAPRAPPYMALPGRNLRYTKWLNLRQLLELSGRETGCDFEDFGLKMTRSGAQAGRNPALRQAPDLMLTNPLCCHEPIPLFPTQRSCDAAGARC